MPIQDQDQVSIITFLKKLPHFGFKVKTFLSNNATEFYVFPNCNFINLTVHP
jgi:hypothetical protein